MSLPCYIFYWLHADDLAYLLSWLLPIPCLDVFSPCLGPGLTPATSWAAQEHSTYLMTSLMPLFTEPVLYLGVFLTICWNTFLQRCFYCSDADTVDWVVPDKLMHGWTLPNPVSLPHPLNILYPFFLNPLHLTCAGHILLGGWPSNVVWFLKKTDSPSPSSSNCQSVHI